MKNWIRLAALTLLTAGSFVLVGHQQRIHAAEPYYANLNQNAQVNIPQYQQTGNGLSNYSNKSLTPVATTPPLIVYNGEFNKTHYSMDETNPGHTYQDQQGNTTFNTYYYLPNGFHADAREYGNYQSIAKVGDNIYVLESLGDNVKQGVIAKYNFNDLTRLGVLGNNGAGLDLIWKAYNYTSPYTAYGKNNLKMEANYQSLLHDASAADQDSQTAITNDQNQVASDQQEAHQYQTQLAKATQAANQFARQTQRTLMKQRRFDTRLTKRLTASNYVQYFTQVTASATKANHQIDTKQKRLQKQLRHASRSHQRQLKLRLQKLVGQKRLISAKIKVNKAALSRFNHGVGLRYQQAVKNVHDANQLVNQDQQTTTTDQQHVSNNVKQLQAAHAQYQQYSAIVAAAQVSPLLNIGHGQTLSYNPVTKNLYLIQDDTLGNLPPNGENTITELSADTLQPIKQFNFQLKHGNNNYSINTLTFDNAGNAYFGRKVGGMQNGQHTFSTYQIYKGTLDENSGLALFSPVPQSINWGGYSNQNLSYNAANNRMYIISDNIITSVPLDKLNAGTVQPSDVSYMSFDINREFEDLAFDAQGYGYLLTLWSPEIMKSQNPMN